jgi:hypothetical protein
MRVAQQSGRARLGTGGLASCASLPRIGIAMGNAVPEVKPEAD